MARKKSRKSGSNRQNSGRTRDTFRITTKNVRSPSYTFQPDLFDDVALSEIQDSRYNYPSSAGWPAVDIRGRLAKLRPNVPNPFSPFEVPAFLGFEMPSKVLVCVRRNIRKQVLFATNKAGRGGQRKPRRNSNSDVRC